MRILFFAQLKDATGCESFELATSGPLSGEELWVRLSETFPKLAAHRGNVRLARNWEYVGGETNFAEGDEVALIPPVSGG